MTLLRVNTQRLGDVREVAAYLLTIEAAYNGIYALDLIVDDAKGRFSESGFGPVDRRPKGRRRSRTISKAENVVLPEDRLRINAISVGSPGFWEFAGALNPLETLRRYLSDRHERRKDTDFRNKLEAERMRLENDRLKTAVVQDRIDLLRDLGFPEDVIREALTRHIVGPLDRIDEVQDAHLIEDATTREEEEQG